MSETRCENCGSGNIWLYFNDSGSPEIECLDCGHVAAVTYMEDG